MVAQTYWRYRSRFANEILAMYEMKNFTDERSKTAHIGNPKTRITMLSCQKRKSQQQRTNPVPLTVDLLLWLSFTRWPASDLQSGLPHPPPPHSNG
jgi:hypothetical protein